jgi:hypothetical protein
MLRLLVLSRLEAVLEPTKAKTLALAQGAVGGVARDSASHVQDCGGRDD